jgi:hypothetical protein
MRQINRVGRCSRNPGTPRGRAGADKPDNEPEREARPHHCRASVIFPGAKSERRNKLLNVLGVTLMHDNKKLNSLNNLNSQNQIPRHGLRLLLPTSSRTNLTNEVPAARRLFEVYVPRWC